MSWIQQNYEKAAIGGAAVVALALVFLGYQKYSSIDETFAATLVGTGNSDPTIPNADQVAVAGAALKLERVLSQAEPGGRPVDLFTGIPLFVKRDSPTVAVDVLKGEPVHPPIPNTWWIENRIDPGFADSPIRDPDEDGFSNIEEFQAKTDPNSVTSHPDLIHKLMYQRDESLIWRLRPREGTADGKYPFNYTDTAGGTNRVRATEPVAPGEIFFADGVAKNRFKLLGNEKKNVFNPRINAEVEVDFVRIADQKENKLNKIYVFEANFAEQRVEFDQADRTAVLTLEALGLGGSEIMVEENTPFALPPDAEEKKYLMKTVTPEEVEVEYTDANGVIQSVKIPKGSMPQMP